MKCWTRKFESIFLIISILTLCLSCQSTPTYTRFGGSALNSTYSVTYENVDTLLRGEVEALLARLDQSLSIFNPNSTISKINRNEEVALDSFFTACFTLAQEVHRNTNGAFDISAAPIFRAWGFESQNTGFFPTQQEIDSLKQFCGMDKIRFENGRISKVDPRVKINANAIAKGYAVDMISDLLKNKGIKNFKVEVGGEVFSHGVDFNGSDWIVNIAPHEEEVTSDSDILAQIHLSGKGLATSGNHRKYYIQDGKKFAHAINPKTGLPAFHNMLTAKVVAKTCSEADAFATALMVMGLDSAKVLLKQHPEIDAFLIYSDSGGYKSYATNGMKQLLVNGKKSKRI